MCIWTLLALVLAVLGIGGGSLSGIVDALANKQ